MNSKKHSKKSKELCAKRQCYHLSLPTQRIMRWQTLLEEYDVTFVHVKGVDNVVVDGISLLDADWQNNDD
jgi:hypothetical protein